MIVNFARAAVVAAALVSAGATAQAQQAKQPSAANLALAKEVLAVKQGTELLDPVITGVIEQVRLRILQTNPMIGKDLNEVAVALRTEYAGRVEEVRNLLYRGYASRFTEAELKELIAFYKSPIGQKVLREEPVIIEQAVRDSEEYSQKFIAEVFDRFRSEMKKRGHEL